jgi:hypothetical protein
MCYRKYILAGCCVAQSLRSSWEADWTLTRIRNLFAPVTLASDYPTHQQSSLSTQHPPNMTANTTIRSALSSHSSSSAGSKCLPKRAVSFAQACKYDAPKPFRRCPTDESVQSTDSRRRYQRRGSKTPAMLLLSRRDLASIQQRRPSINCDYCLSAAAAAVNSPRTVYQRRMSGTSSSVATSTDAVVVCSPARCLVAENTEYATARQRRMSLMTALKQNLECSLILETPTVVKTIRRMSTSANQSYALELLSHS